MDKISSSEEYVDVHGRDVKVFICEETGNILIPISEVKKTGFNIYHKTQYNKLHVSESQFHKEFHLYMLEAATTYMLQRQTAFKEEVLFESIDKCKRVLTGENSIQQNNSNFMKSHTVVNAPNSSLIIKASPETPQDKRNVRSFANKSPSQDFLKTHVKQDRPGVDLNSSSSPNWRISNSSPKSISSNSNTSDEKRFQKPAERRDNFNLNKDGPKNTPQLRQPLKNHNFNSDQSKPTQSDTDTEKESLPKLPAIQLDQPQHKVLVTYIEKPSVIWVQDSANLKVLVDIDRIIKEEIDNCPEASGRKIWNKMYLAQDEGLWFRCRIIKFKPALTVVFVDYGNTAEVGVIRIAPSALETIPCQAVKVVLENSKLPEMYDNVILSINRRSENGTAYAEIVTEDAPNAAKALPAKAAEPAVHSVPTYFTKPEPMCKAQNNQKIMIAGRLDGSFVVRTRESFQKLKDIEEAIKNSATEKLVSLQKEQLVLCKSNNNFHRGVITNIEPNMIHVKYLDYYETVKVSSECIKNINEPLSLEPITFYVTPQVKGYVDNEGAKKFLEGLVVKRVKGTVVLEGNEFDLMLSDGLLSEKLTQFQVNSNRTMFKDMKKYEPPIGIAEYIVYYFRSVNDLTLVSADVLDIHLRTAIKRKDEMEDGFYEPVVGEVCYGDFEESWSRAVVLEKSNDEYKVKFVDFGNLATLTKEQLRELTEDAKEVFVLGFTGHLIGLPSLDNIDEALKPLFQDYESYDFNVKKLNGDHYEVELPSIHKLL